jgi:5-(carboxyamino)imidazole ribonucleotide mutase
VVGRVGPPGGLELIWKSHINRGIQPQARQQRGRTGEGEGMEHAKVVIFVGSKSDLAVVQATEETLRAFGVSFRTLVRSAHRTPVALRQAIVDAETNGCLVFVCAAGMAAHLAGAVSAETVKPVIGIPLAVGALGGADALYSTVMMPPGVPVATVGIDSAKNAGLLAVQILAVQDEALTRRLKRDRAEVAERVLGTGTPVER